MVTSQLNSWFGDCDVMIGNYHSFGHLGLESWVFNKIKTLEITFLRNIMRFQTFDPLSRLSGTLSPWERVVLSFSPGRRCRNAADEGFDPERK